MFSSCRKYNDPWGCKDCPRVSDECSCENYPDINDTTSVLVARQRYLQGESIEMGTFRIQHVQANPINSNQLLFYEIPIGMAAGNSDANAGFVLYDIASREKTYLVDIIGVDLPSISYEWDFNNNIYLNYFDLSSKLGGIGRYNTVTGEFSSVTFPNVEETRGVSWLKKTNSIGFTAIMIKGGRVGQNYFTYNFESQVLDTFIHDTVNFEKVGYYDNQWSDDLLINGGVKNTGEKYVLAYYDWPNSKCGVVAKSWQFKSGLNNELGYLSYKWLPNSTKLYMAHAETGIHYSNVKGSNLVRIKKHCDNLRYIEIDITGDGSKLIALRRQYRYSNIPPRPTWVDGWLYTKDEIVMMDIDGCNEEVIYKGY
ncbi:MAG: hypothetical protein ACPGLV_08445 [Bacteroidia bacterium]